MSAREVRLSDAAWLILFGVLFVAGCGGGGCQDDCPSDQPAVTLPSPPCAASKACV